MAKQPKACNDATPSRDALVLWGSTHITKYEQKTVDMSRVERVLCIDPGVKNVAICFLDIANKRIETTKIEYPPEIKTKFGQMRYLEETIRYWIFNRLPDLIIKEGPALGMQFGVAQAGQIQYVVERTAFDFNIPFYTVNPTTMRRYLGTAGKNHGKSDTKLVVFKRWGAEFPSEDECDAFAVAQTGMAILRGEFSAKAEPKPRKKKAAA